MTLGVKYLIKVLENEMEAQERTLYETQAYISDALTSLERLKRGLDDLKEEVNR